MEVYFVKTRLDQRLAERLQSKKTELDNYRLLSVEVLKRLYEQLRILLTYHSNAIEGNSLSLRETQMVIENGLTIGGHPLKDYLEATNHAQAFDYLTELAQSNQPISLNTILSIHKLVMKDTHSSAGQLRNGPVFIRGASTTPPPAAQVSELLSQWLYWVEGESKQYEPVISAAIAHSVFESIHPFFDGNGRTGRLLMNLMLMQTGYPPALLQKEWRNSYITALDNATAEGNFSPLANLVGRAVESSLDLYLASAKSVKEDNYKSLPELAKLAGYRVQYLGWLIREGKIEGSKRAGRWYSTLEAINHYKNQVEAGQFPKGRPKKPEQV